MSFKTLAIVGSLTRDTPFFESAQGRGLSVFSFDEASGALELLSETTGDDNPTYLAVNAEERFLCVTSEVYEWHEGVVTSYAIDPTLGRLTYRNKQATLGHLSAFVDLDRSGRNILVSNYSMQAPDVAPGRCLVVLPIRDGLIAPASDSLTRAGSGPIADRQERSHAHCLLEMPDGRLVTADLGTDEVAFYDFDAAAGTMSAAPVETLALPEGSGPRHVAWSRDGQHLYVLNELASTVAAFVTPRRLERVQARSDDSKSAAKRAAELGRGHSNHTGPTIPLCQQSRRRQHHGLSARALGRPAPADRCAGERRPDPTKLRHRPDGPISDRREPRQPQPDSAGHSPRYGRVVERRCPSPDRFADLREDSRLLIVSAACNRRLRRSVFPAGLQVKGVTTKTIDCKATGPSTLPP